MRPLILFEARYGRDEPPPEIVILRAGKFEPNFEGGDLRYIRYASLKLICRIYVAIRDVNL